MGNGRSLDGHRTTWYDDRVHDYVVSVNSPLDSTRSKVPHCEVARTSLEGSESARESWAPDRKLIRRFRSMVRLTVSDSPEVCLPLLESNTSNLLCVLPITVTNAFSYIFI